MEGVLYTQCSIIIYGLDGSSTLLIVLALMISCYICSTVQNTSNRTTIVYSKEWHMTLLPPGSLQILAVTIWFQVTPSIMRIQWTESHFPQLSKSPLSLHVNSHPLSSAVPVTLHSVLIGSLSTLQMLHPECGRKFRNVRSYILEKSRQV